MRFLAVCHLLAILLMIFSLTMLPPIAIDLYFGVNNKLRTITTHT